MGSLTQGQFCLHLTVLHIAGKTVASRTVQIRLYGMVIPGPALASHLEKKKIQLNLNHSCLKARVLTVIINLLEPVQRTLRDQPNPLPLHGNETMILVACRWVGSRTSAHRSPACRSLTCVGQSEQNSIPFPPQMLRT